MIPRIAAVAMFLWLAYCLLVPCRTSPSRAEVG